MKRKNEGQTSMDLEKPVALTDEQVAVKDTHIRTLIREIKALKTEVKQATSRNRKRIAEAEAEIEHEMELIDQGLELRKQGDLFAGDEAKRALHDVAKKVDPAIAGGNGSDDGESSVSIAKARTRPKTKGPLGRKQARA
jgi:hypothetical protein